MELSCDADMVHLGIVVRIFNFQKLASLQCYVGSVRAAVEPKQVMFSDGIRPGGDLTELDGVDAVQSSAQSTGRRSKKQDKSGSTQLLCQRDYVIRSVCLSVCVCVSVSRNTRKVVDKFGRDFRMHRFSVKEDEG